MFWFIATIVLAGDVVYERVVLQKCINVAFRTKGTSHGCDMPWYMW